LGIAGLAAISGSRQRGTGWAVSGVLIGVADVIGWTILLAVLFLPEAQNVREVEFMADLSALEGVGPQINRAMRANALTESRTAWAVLRGTSIGSGVILRIADREALIVTNRHVIDAHWNQQLDARARRGLGAAGLSVTMLGQMPSPAEVVWVAPAGIDLAL